MSTAQIYQYVVIDRPGRPAVQIGSLSEARSVALGDGEVIDRDFSVAALGIVKIFDKTEDESLGNFDLLSLECDLDLWIQFTTDAGTTDAYDVKKLKGSGTAGEMGPAMILGSDNTQLPEGTIDAFDGAADTIDEVWAYNPDDTNAARIRLVVAT